jgi:negative regulator of flagellin synthesis FlgM
MKIDNNMNSYMSQSPSESTVRTPAAKAADTPPPSQGVSVNIGSSSQLRSMESSAANAPMVDAKKVAEIKLAISEGRFQINAAAIADSLINDVNDLLSAAEQR